MYYWISAKIPACAGMTAVGIFSSATPLRYAGCLTGFAKAA